jgi:nucleotide-binding universal stress UspA family protein
MGVTLTEKNVGIEARVAVKRVLVPVDKSGYKEKIMAYAVSLGKAWGAELTTVHVIDPGRGIPGGRVKEKEQEREKEAKREAEILLVQLVDPLARKEGVNIKKEVIEESDTVEKAIVDYAKKNNMDVIVIGTKGISGVEEYFIGSVANAVIHHAHCPVFAIH